jgi:hypothetical protein
LSFGDEKTLRGEADGKVISDQISATRRQEKKRLKSQESKKVKEFGKKKDNAPLAARGKETRRTQRFAEKKQRNPRAQSRVTVPQSSQGKREKPKTQAHTPCLGHPRRREKRKRDPSTPAKRTGRTNRATRPDAPEGGAKEKIGPLRSG